MALPGRRGLGTVVHEHIKSLLLDGHFEPNSWIPVDEIAAELEVSRQPLMDALKRLSVEGFITIVPQVGCKPRTHQPAEIRDFYKLFAEGECLVAELAVKNATEDDILILKNTSSRIGALREPGVHDREIGRVYRKENRSFHAEIRRIANSPVLTEIVESLGDRSDFFIAMAKAPIFAERLRDAHEEHEEIITAIVERDAARAGAVMRKHISSIAKRIGGAL